MLGKLFKWNKVPQTRGEGAVVFVLPVNSAVRLTPDMQPKSELASHRLRVLIPAAEIAKRKPVWLVPIAELIRDPGLSLAGRVDAVVIGKLAGAFVDENRGALESLLDKLGQQGTDYPLFADLSDDYAALGELLKRPYLARYQRRLGALARFTTCSTALAEALGPDAGRGIEVIEDPFEMPAAAARAPRHAPLRLLWFGNFGTSTSAFLTGALSGLARGLGDFQVSLEFIAHREVAALAAQLGAALRTCHPRLEFRFTPWSVESTSEAIERCDIVVLPQDHASRYGRVKSANRMVSALRGGRLAVASPIPSYEDLARYGWVGEDLAQGVRWAAGHPDEALERVVEGQRAVAERFSPERIGKRWLEVLTAPAVS